jgi:hypothetical protein
VTENQRWSIGAVAEMTKNGSATDAARPAISQGIGLESGGGGDVMRKLIGSTSAARVSRNAWSTT